MKKFVLLAGLFLMMAGSVLAQEWKTTLVNSLAQKFSITTELSQKLVNTKESYFRQLQQYEMPHVEAQMGKAGKRKAIADLRNKELASFKSLLGDEAKASQVSEFLEGKIPAQTQQRKR